MNDNDRLPRDMACQAIFLLIANNTGRLSRPVKNGFVKRSKEFFIDAMKN
jgi:hypothetical protein